MITGIELVNFKCFRELKLELKPLTVFIGENATGKSTAAQGLFLLKQSVEAGSLKTAGDYVNLGIFNDVLNKDPKETFFVCGMKGNCSVPPRLVELGFADRVEFDYRPAFRDEQLDGHHVEMRIGSRVNFGIYSFQGTYQRGVPIGNPIGHIRDIVGGTIEINCNNNIKNPLAMGNISGPSDINKRAEFDLVTRSVQEVLLSIRKVLRSTSLVPASRGFDRPFYPLPASKVLDPLYDGPLNYAANLLGILHYQRDLRKKLSEWFNGIAGFGIDLNYQENHQVGLETTGGVSLANEGFGWNQLAFVLVQVGLAPEEGTVVIEEPEIHLHPKAQAQVAELLAKVVRDEKKQILITTHGERILSKLLTLVAKGEFPKEKLAIYYFERKDGETTARALKIDDLGRIEGGLPGFFEAGVEELTEYLEALHGKGKKE